MNLNLPGSRRWRLHDHTRVHASRERYQSTQVYVELHDDIGLPHTLYNVLVGVFPSILRRWHRRDAFNNTGPPPQAEEGALEVRQAPKYLRDEARPFENVAGRAPQGYKGEEESFSES